MLLFTLEEMTSINPFSDLTNKKSDFDEQISASRTGLLAFFLCSFDTTRGLQILFSSPKKLPHGNDELDILKTHCVWKIEKTPLRIDLKFSDYQNRVFSNVLYLFLNSGKLSCYIYKY